MAIKSFSGDKVEHKYSTKEELTGMSKDGENIYRKILELDVLEMGTFIFEHNIGIKEYVNVYGTCYVYNQTKTIRPIPYYDGSGRIWVSNLFQDKVHIHTSWPQCKVWLTIEFIKNE